MFKTLVTLFRGQVAASSEEFADRNALLILNQQLRDANASLDRAKKALALAIAQDRQEGQRLDATKARIADLEARVSAAMEAGRDDLAREGAEAIAALEEDANAAATSRTLFASEISRLRRHVTQAQMRISDVDRGRRVALAAEAVRKLREGGIEPAGINRATISEAEETLKRLRQRQAEQQAADAALEELDSANGPVSVAEKLAEQGFGPRRKTSAEDVLERLKARSGTNTKQAENA